MSMTHHEVSTCLLKQIVETHWPLLEFVITTPPATEAEVVVKEARRRSEPEGIGSAEASELSAGAHGATCTDMHSSAVEMPAAEYHP